ncbi:hypothetical protein [Propylenella binzhouense]|uniref:Sulfotransferase family protein n=1 Tax=Propylenella binzhouense TaxID=2555902 RepID=A0A964WVF0_9HYPH|nr:hypothetical protein [Propylenella binzhouense]MYZ49984.1 hypothetical protein [Propylenella binzhouense]
MAARRIGARVARKHGLRRLFGPFGDAGGPETERRLVLHIGANKTGTSALQTWLAINAPALLERGVFYPSPGIGVRADRKTADRIARTAGDRFTRAVANGNTLYLYRLLRPEVRPEGFDQEEFIRRLETVLGNDLPVVLFSGEHLQLADPDWLAFLRDAALAEGRRIEIAYVMRNLAEHAFSVWMQEVKRGGSAADFSAFADLYQAPFAACWAKFAGVFGEAAILPIRYEDIRQDLVGGFLARVFGWRVADAAVPVVNPALSERQLPFMLAANRRLARIGGGAALRASVALSDYFVLKAQAEPVRPHATPDQLKAIERMNGEGLAWLNARLATRLDAGFPAGQGLLLADMPVVSASSALSAAAGPMGALANAVADLLLADPDALAGMPAQPDDGIAALTEPCGRAGRALEAVLSGEG